MTRRDKLKGRHLLCLFTVPIIIQVLVLSLPLTCRSSYEMAELWWRSSYNEITTEN